MAFQTNVLRGGEWVTETINLQAVLKAGSSTQGQKKQRLLKAPQCGILTRTVVESHLVNSILPVRLRSPRHNDVAFIGVSLVFIFGDLASPFSMLRAASPPAYHNPPCLLPSSVLSFLLLHRAQNRPNLASGSTSSAVWDEDWSLAAGLALVATTIQVAQTSPWVVVLS
jgi:hypothetical protein